MMTFLFLDYNILDMNIISFITIYINIFCKKGVKKNSLRYIKKLFYKNRIL